MHQSINTYKKRIMKDIEKILEFYLSEIESNYLIGVQFIYNLTALECNELRVMIECISKRKEITLGKEGIFYRGLCTACLKSKLKSRKRYKEATRALCYVSNKAFKLDELIMDSLKLFVLLVGCFELS